ncbi:MAG: periplasmic heavy metal sensor [Proteobacteria bacterium]|nr:periplasmic heavy metal sensor [Pseudomonadota bacterium]
MKRFPKILAATCTALLLSASMALAAEAPKTVKPAPVKPAPAAQPAHQMSGIMGGGMMGGMKGGHMGLAALSPEKQEIAKALMTEHRGALFPLHQSMYAKNAELEALNAAGNGDSDKAKTVIRDIADLNAKMLVENGKFRARLVKETGLRTAPMGHGMMAGGMGGMMGGDMKCPMMEKMMGGMQHGAAGDPGASRGTGMGAGMNGTTAHAPGHGTTGSVAANQPHVSDHAN